MIKIGGLDKLTRELGQFQKAIGELDGDICKVSFNPGDPGSIEQAICQMEAAIDERAGAYSGNGLVASMVENVKEHFRQAILDKAESARLESDGSVEE